MEFPAFFAKVPTITLRDPLAAFLGASRSGSITYCYADAVKLAGHSCPTVAGAYLMVHNGLTYLYGDDLPERGGIEVYLRDGRDQGTTGVIASIATLLTGAAPETGFGGIGADHCFARRDLLQFDAPIDGVVALRRIDNSRGVMLDLDTNCVRPHPEMGILLAKAIAGQANAAEQVRFATLWQDRVERMLLEHTNDPQLVRLVDWRRAI